jgi:hypothetical protein
VAEGIELARYDPQHELIRQQTAPCDDSLGDKTNLGPSELRSVERRYDMNIAPLTFLRCVVSIDHQ